MYDISVPNMRIIYRWQQSSVLHCLVVAAVVLCRARRVSCALSERVSAFMCRVVSSTYLVRPGRSWRAKLAPSPTRFCLAAPWQLATCYAHVSCFSRRCWFRPMLELYAFLQPGKGHLCFRSTFAPLWHTMCSRWYCKRDRCLDVRQPEKE